MRKPHCVTDRLLKSVGFFMRQRKFGKPHLTGIGPGSKGRGTSSITSPAYNLLPDKIAAVLPKLGETSENPDPTFHVKWFTPDANFTWFLAEFDPESRIGYGFVVGPFPEWGTFALDEIRRVRGALGLPVERDLHFSPCPSSEITKDYY